MNEVELEVIERENEGDSDNQATSVQSGTPRIPTVVDHVEYKLTRDYVSLYLQHWKSKANRILPSLAVAIAESWLSKQSTIITLIAELRATRTANIALTRERDEAGFDEKRILEWMTSTDRKCAELAFTSGSNRQAATLIEIAEDRLKRERDEAVAGAARLEIALKQSAFEIVSRDAEVERLREVLAECLPIVNVYRALKNPGLSSLVDRIDDVLKSYTKASPQ